MAEKTKIAWTHHTFNPWSGCSKVSEGCANCYAEVNYSVKVRGVKWGPSGNRIVKAESGWSEPLKWDRQAAKQFAIYEEHRHQGGPAYQRPRVFCASLADVFEDWTGRMLAASGHGLWIEQRGVRAWVEDDASPGFAFEKSPLTMQDVRARLFRLIDATPCLDWLLLTKRPENIRRMIPGMNGCDLCADNQPHKRENLWLGASVESAEYLPRIDALKAQHNYGRLLFLSIEPLLGPLPTLGEHIDGIDWVIAGGESGPKARPFDLAWARSLRDQCAAAGAPYFLKQLGGNLSDADLSECARAVGRRMQDRAGADPAEWPADLQGCRAYPA